MSNFFNLCQLRTSVRAFQSTLPRQADINYIKSCVRLAPSAVNKQPWKFFYITQPTLLSQIHDCYKREWFTTAPAVFVAVKNEQEQWVRPSDGHAHGEIDIAIATEHLCLAAAECGLGTCWVCNFDEKKCREALQLLPHQKPCVLIPIGYESNKSNTPRSAKRKDEAEIFEDIE